MAITDTIAAVSTALGAGGIGIVRISGDKSLDVIKRIFTGKKDELKSHSITYGTIRDSEGAIVDEVLVTVMLKPHTYTREDVVEINCHGGIKSVQAVLAEVIKNGARLAEPGEFTKRAFLNGRIDLSQGEAVMDIINAKTELSRKAAMVQLRGEVSRKISDYMEEILTMTAHIEASIDYPEHELEEMNICEISEKTNRLIKNLEELIETAQRGKILREGIETAIIGRPNVGKSSLLNALLDEDRAIVTDIPGTTRDVLQEYISINGIPLHITDTAGMRDTADIIERIGVDKSKTYAEKADLILLVLDGAEELSPQDVEVLKFVAGKRIIVLINKSDLAVKISSKQISGYVNEDDIIEISAKDGTGMDKLYSRIKELFFGGDVTSHTEPVMASVRQIDAINRAREALINVKDTIEAGMTEDFITIDLLSAYRCLGEITGSTLEEDVIDKIFSEFCLGK